MHQAIFAVVKTLKQSIPQENSLKLFGLLHYFAHSSKRVCTHGLELPYGAHIFTLSLFFINPDMCVENPVRTFQCLFCVYIRPHQAHVFYHVVKKVIVASLIAVISVFIIDALWQFLLNPRDENGALLPNRVIA